MLQLDLLTQQNNFEGRLQRGFSNFEFAFPEPQYLGAKHTHLDWIRKFIPTDTKSAIDAFSGSQSVAFLFKQLGYKTVTNDYLNFNNQIGLALIENKQTLLSKKDLEVLFAPAPNKKEFRLIESTFTNLFFDEGEARFLDNFRANIQYLENPYKRAIAFAVINRSMTRKITMGHFGHTQALSYAADPERIKRNKSLIRPIRSLFEELLPKYNSAVFDNNQLNLSFNRNIIDLLPEVDDLDLAYFDPPYCGSHADYQGFYHLLETYTEYWKDKQFIKPASRNNAPHRRIFVLSDAFFAQKHRFWSKNFKMLLKS